MDSKPSLLAGELVPRLLSYIKIKLRSYTNPRHLTGPYQLRHISFYSTNLAQQQHFFLKVQMEVDLTCAGTKPISG